MKKLFKIPVIFFLIIPFFSLFHQEGIAAVDTLPKFDGTVVIDSDYIDEYSNYIKIKYYDENKNFVVKSLSQDSTLISIERYTDSTEKTQIGESKYWHDNGKIKRIENYNKEGKLQGKLFTYYDNGVLKREENYENDEFKTGKCYDSLGKEINHFPYFKDPNIDLNELSSCLKYPEDLRRSGIEEKVILRVFINKFGNIVRIKYNKSNYEGFLNESIRCLIKMKYIPSAIDGEPFGCWVFIPVNFTLR